MQNFSDLVQKEQQYGNYVIYTSSSTLF